MFLTLGVSFLALLVLFSALLVLRIRVEQARTSIEALEPAHV